MLTSVGEEAEARVNTVEDGDRRCLSASLRRRVRRGLRFLSGTALGAGLLVSFANDACAQEPSPASDRYVVVTNDGSRFEGELVERVVGNHVTLKLATGDIRTIQAADVKAEWRPGQGPVGVSTGVIPTVQVTNSPLVTGVPLAYHGPDEVQIHLTNTNNESGTLYRESASGWEVVCQMPCTTTVDPKISYKLHNSDPFRFPSGARSLDLVADIGSRRRNAGWAVGLLTTGIVVASLSPLPFVLLDGSTATTAGWITVGVGAAMIIGGIVLLAVGPSTTLTTTSGQRIAKQPGIRLPGNITFTPAGFVF